MTILLSRFYSMFSWRHTTSLLLMSLCMAGPVLRWFPERVMYLLLHTYIRRLSNIRDFSELATKFLQRSQPRSLTVCSISPHQRQSFPACFVHFRSRAQDMGAPYSQPRQVCPTRPSDDACMLFMLFIACVRGALVFFSASARSLSHAAMNRTDLPEEGFDFSLNNVHV